MTLYKCLMFLITCRNSTPLEKKFEYRELQNVQAGGMQDPAAPMGYPVTSAASQPGYYPLGVHSASQPRPFPARGVPSTESLQRIQESQPPQQQQSTGTGNYMFYEDKDDLDLRSVSMADGYNGASSGAFFQRH